MIEVYHNTEFLMFMTNPIMESLKLGHFEKVATVITDDLEVAYRETNNIDQPWHLNTNVNAVRRENRSTSVGDLLKQDSKFYIVESFGFRELTPKESCEITFFINKNYSQGKSDIIPIKDIIRIARL